MLLAHLLPLFFILYQVSRIRNLPNNILLCDILLPESNSLTQLLIHQNLVTKALKSPAKPVNSPAKAAKSPVKAANNPPKPATTVKVSHVTVSTDMEFGCIIFETQSPAFFYGILETELQAVTGLAVSLASAAPEGDYLPFNCCEL